MNQFSPDHIASGSYLEKLIQVEQVLPRLLRNDSEWTTLDIDYLPPRVERLWREYNNLRIYLHRIYPSLREEIHFHPHPWPCAVRLLKGSYEMGIGYGERDKAPPLASTLLLAQGTCYEMIERNSWHYVCPQTEITYSLMIAGKPWEGLGAKSTLSLEPLPNESKQEILVFFRTNYCKKR